MNLYGTPLVMDESVFSMSSEMSVSIWVIKLYWYWSSDFSLGWCNLKSAMSISMMMKVTQKFESGKWFISKHFEDKLKSGKSRGRWNEVGVRAVSPSPESKLLWNTQLWTAQDKDVHNGDLLLQEGSEQWKCPIYIFFFSYSFICSYEGRQPPISSCNSAPW